MGKGLWQTAGKALLRRVLVDTRHCGTHASAVLEESLTSATLGPANAFSGKKPLPEEGAVRPILFGVRLGVEGGRISEIESIIAREREFAFDAEGVLATKDQDWESLLPPEERSSRLAGLVVALVHFAGSLPDFHVFKMRNGKVERINAVVGPWSASMGWAPVPECLSAASR